MYRPGPQCGSMAFHKTTTTTSAEHTTQVDKILNGARLTRRRLADNLGDTPNKPHARKRKAPSSAGQ